MDTITPPTLNDTEAELDCLRMLRRWPNAIEALIDLREQGHDWVPIRHYLKHLLRPTTMIAAAALSLGVADAAPVSYWRAHHAELRVAHAKCRDTDPAIKTRACQTVEQAWHEWEADEVMAALNKRQAHK